MVQVIYSMLGAKNKVLDTHTCACYAGCGQHIAQQRALAVGLMRSRCPIMPSQTKLFDFIRSSWDFPKLMADVGMDEYNNGAMIVMDTNKYSMWEIFNYGSLLRYLDDHSESSRLGHKFDSEFPGYNKTFTRYVDSGLNPTHAFIMAGLFGGSFWNTNHMMFHRTMPIGSLEKIESMEDLRRPWPKLPPAIKEPQHRPKEITERAAKVSEGTWEIWTAFWHSVTEPPYKSVHRASVKNALKILYPTDHERVNDMLKGKL